jgi:hypothetical protein
VRTELSVFQALRGERRHKTPSLSESTSIESVHPSAAAVAGYGHSGRP